MGPLQEGDLRMLEDGALDCLACTQSTHRSLRYCHDDLAVGGYGSAGLTLDPATWQFLQEGRCAPPKRYGRTSLPCSSCSVGRWYLSGQSALKGFFSAACFHLSSSNTLQQHPIGELLTAVLMTAAGPSV